MATHDIQESGGDFTTLDAAFDSGSTSGGDTFAIKGTWSSDDTSPVSWSKAVTVTVDSSSKHPGYPHEGTGTWYRLRPNNGHAITVTADVDMTGVDVQNQDSSVSDEVFRISSAADVDCTDCLLGFNAEVDEQDVLYSSVDSSTMVWTFTSCMFYDVGRSVVDIWDADSNTITVNFNACSGYNVGGQGARGGGCYVGAYDSTSTVTINAFSCLFHGQDDYLFNGHRVTITANYDYCISSHGSSDLTDGHSENTTGNGWSYSFSAGADPGAGDNVVYENITTGSIDLRLYDNANNDAIDFHSVETGPNSGLSLPSDILGTSRGAAEDHDVGAYEIAAGGTPGLSIPVAMHHYMNNIGAR